MARIEGADPERTARRVRAVLGAQARKWGAPLPNHLIYARRPSIFQGARASRARRLGASRPRAGCAGEPQGGGSERLRLLTGHQRCRGQRAEDTRRQDPRPRRVCYEPPYEEAERVALEYADAITLSDRDVDEDLFERVRDLSGEDALIELTAVIAWENASSKFNRALRVPSQGLWKRKDR